MSKCPKCGSYKIIGPKYEAGGCGDTKYGGERLRYRCYDCGYSVTTETKDAREKREPAKAGA